MSIAKQPQPSQPDTLTPGVRSSSASLPIVRIRPSKGWVSLDLKELWHYRDLCYLLSWRDVKVRYKQTALGVSWAIIQPFMNMVVMSLLFGQLAKMPSDGVPYPIFAYTALLPWQFFAYALTNASTSLVVNERIITKVYFPRILVPTAAVLAGLIDLGIAFVVLLGMMLFYGIVPTWAVCTLPFFLLLAIATALGVSFWFSALDVQYRDVRYTIPFLTQFWMFATPIIYPSSILPAPWHWIAGLNPMTGVVEGFRWALLGTVQISTLQLLVSTIVVLLCTIGGAFFFRRMEKTLADVV